MRVGSGEEIPLFPSDADYSSFIQREGARVGVVPGNAAADHTFV